jgi:probable O-glycosylation ligase (exosortase A-associated)
LGKIFFALLLIGTALAALARPWIGVVGAYVIAVLTPQTVWWWNFQGLRPAFWILLPTMAGFAWSVLAGKVTFAPLSNKRTAYLLILWLFIGLSFYFGPYVNLVSPLRVTDPEWAFSTLNKMFILYFLAAACIDSKKKTMVLAYVLAGTVIYYVYWANDMYLSGRGFGRLGGPTGPDYGGVYADQNNFGMLFVVGLPFLWFLGHAVKNNVLRWSLWLVIPFGWHAVFLTGSRGALLGVAATLALTVWRSKRRALGLLLIPAFAIAYVWQAGDLMRDRAATLSEFDTERSAAGRLEAWGAATNMVVGNPAVGVGLASFVPAFPEYSEKAPREAHNTFFQIAAESGLVAGIMYILIVTSCLYGLWRNGIRLREKEEEDGLSDMYWLNEAVLVGFSGLVVVSLFLSMQMMEIFYYMCVMTNAILYVSSLSEAPQKKKQPEQVVAYKQE